MKKSGTWMEAATKEKEPILSSQFINEKMLMTWAVWPRIHGMVIVMGRA